jgi:vitamin B12 transporter
LAFHRFLVFLLLSIPAFATDLQVRILDPNSAVVNTARVTLLKGNGPTIVAVRHVAADGVVRFTSLPESAYTVRVLAPGFAENNHTLSLPQSDPVDIKLAVAATPETVVVTATATPLIAQASGVAISTLESPAITLLNPADLGDSLRYVPGAIVSDTGRRGSLTTLFVRGGDSRYNKVIIDGVPVNDPGGTFDFGIVPMQQVDRLELLRGSASTLYGSDAMTSVVQLFTSTGKTRVPEIRFGADGGTFSTANGYGSIAGARGIFDYNVFAEQFNTDGQGVNDNYSNSSQGTNLGAQLGKNVALRVRVRHNNNRTGIASNWWFNGNPELPPDADQYARQNNLLASAELTIAGPGKLTHRITGFEYNHVRKNVDTVNDPARPFDDPFDSRVNYNRAGLSYQGEYAETLGRSVFGYYFEDENGFIDTTYESFGFAGESHTHGLRRNQAIYGEQIVNWKRLSLVGGLRYEHNESFGDKAIPRISATGLIFRGQHVLSGTRLRFNYSQGIKAPTFEESFGVSGTFPTNANPNLKPEQANSIDTGFQQNFLDGRFTFSGTYFHNIFTNQIQFSVDPQTFEAQYINIKKALAQGAELEIHGRLGKNISINGGYIYTSTEALDSPECQNGGGCSGVGQPLLRRPKHAGNVLLTYSGSRWGSSVGGTFVGRRPDSDFFFGAIPPVDYAAGYGRVDVGGWYEINHYVTAYANIGNVLNHAYNDVVGYPGLKANFRAGLRFRFGGE